MKKIIVSVTNDLVTDQRVHKVCSSLHDAGYEVLLAGRRFRASKPVSRAYRTYRMRLIFNRKMLFYAEYNLRLFFYLLFARADIFLSNDTDSLPANYCAAILRRKPLIFDAHEMFPEVPELVGRPFVKAVWQKIEDLIFPHLKYCYTVCASIADIYNERYGIEMQVVRNVPLATLSQPVRKKTLAGDGKKVLLYQGAVNVGRGIEWVIDAMPYLDDCVFYVIGDGDIAQEVQEKTKSLGLEDRVRFLGKVPFEDLFSYTSQADIGLVLLKNRGLNYYYSLPNRIFDFIQVEVPVLATDFPEIRRIVATYNTGILIDHYEPKFLADTVRKMLAMEKDTAGFAAANVELSWEKESKTILEIAKKSQPIKVKQQ
ncbi:MAG: glycosyltransferase [Dysgonamonadaceae bacterium]|nr:glycosyltransferase [Dysgonamonadaceae bacterium]